MNKWMSFSLAFAVLLIGSPATAQEQGVIKPQLLLNEIVQGMPKDERQEVRVLTATFQRGDKTMFHTHRFPVTVYDVRLPDTWPRSRCREVNRHFHFRLASWVCMEIPVER